MAKKSKIDAYVIEKVRKRREELAITAADLSYRMGKSYNYISNIESGEKHYNIFSLNEVAKILQCSPRDFWPEEPL